MQRILPQDDTVPDGDQIMWKRYRRRNKIDLYVQRAFILILYILLISVLVNDSKMLSKNDETSENKNNTKIKNSMKTVHFFMAVCGMIVGLTIPMATHMQYEEWTHFRNSNGEVLSDLLKFGIYTSRYLFIISSIYIGTNKELYNILPCYIRPLLFHFYFFPITVPATLVVLLWMIGATFEAVIITVSFLLTCTIQILILSISICWIGKTGEELIETASNFPGIWHIFYVASEYEPIFLKSHGI